MLRRYSCRLGTVLLVSWILALGVGGVDAQSIQMSSYDAMRQEMLELAEAHLIDPSRLMAFVGDCNFPIIAFEQNSEIGFTPGSVQNLLATAAALDRLGPDFRYRTRVEVTGEMRGNALHGNLLVRGSGDPSLGSRFSEHGANPTGLFAVWAKRLQAEGIRRINGHLIMDDTCFDVPSFGLAWPLSGRGESFLPEVGGLSFNDNCVNIHFQGARRAGRSASFTMDPATDLVLFRNSVQTGPRGTIAAVAFERQANSNLIHATGAVGVRERHLGRASVSNPTEFFGVVMRDTLRKNKIAVQGDVVSLRGYRDRDYITSGARLIHEEVSMPLSEMVTVANRHGQSLYSEAFLRTLGLDGENGGSVAAGIEALRGFLTDSELSAPNEIIRDGSGLSLSNSLSARFFGRLLIFMSKHAASDLYLQSLPEPGKPGLLERRFVQGLTREADAASRIRAVPGFIAGTHVLAGYATTAGGGRLAFVFSINDSRMKTQDARNLLDDLALVIARSPLVCDR